MDNKQEVVDWIRLADSDLETADFLFANMMPKPLEIICFHCQQSAEKFIKGFLRFGNQQVKKTHDLVYLFKAATEIADDFNLIIQNCVFLNPFSVDSRYPYALQIDESICLMAKENARKVRDFVCAKIESR